MEQQRKHPKGLIAAALANMGERFGFYTMMAILVLFLSAKFGLSETQAGTIYSTFYFGIYALALIGGIIADRTKNFKGTILVGLILMTAGYAILSIPTEVTAGTKSVMLIFTCFALFVIALGNGLFKGNLQALVGQMYDDPAFDNKQRDAGFSLFYMFINVGSIFAPWIAPGIRAWWLRVHHFEYNAQLPELCHKYLDGTISADQVGTMQRLADEVSLNGSASDLGSFATSYLDVFNTGFHYSFAIAIVAMLVSLVIYLANKKNFPDPAAKLVSGQSVKQQVPDMPMSEVKQRITALIAVFAVVIFFWFSFHQNGLTLTFFARDYTQLDFFSFIKLTPEMFQSANPFFVVFLTPIVMALFAFLAKRGKAIPTPGKIAIGMGLAAAAYVVMAVGSVGLPTLAEAKAMDPAALQQVKVTPYLLIGVYFLLTVAELFISPLGLSFVSQVAPPKMQGIMQGLWLLATGLGNQLLFIGAMLYSTQQLWVTWSVFVGVCIISMLIMFSMLGWLVRVTSQKH
ncbi:MAG: peptide MFS transporter [Porphyromonas sp.]|nr:peptide MFS transporter [Porphyromonas sp.]